MLEYKLGGYLEFVKETVRETRKIDELDLNVHQMARLKRKILPNLKGGF